MSDSLKNIIDDYRIATEERVRRHFKLIKDCPHSNLMMHFRLFDEISYRRSSGNRCIECGLVEEDITFGYLTDDQKHKSKVETYEEFVENSVHSIKLTKDFSDKCNGTKYNRNKNVSLEYVLSELEKNYSFPYY